MAQSSRLRTSASGIKAPLQVAGLFAGIGGIELGLERAGHVTRLLCENDTAAMAVLRERFPKIVLRGDIRRLRALPKVDLITAGFPCQDLSQAGRTVGIAGNKSGLIKHVFRLLRNASDPEWVLLENVPFMFQLDRGRAMSWLTAEFEDLGYRWAYRTVDTRSFGLPHRRRRVLFLASKRSDPRSVLFTNECAALTPRNSEPSTYGFYWTEGNTGIGWAKDSVPTLKGGSGLGIPSPPAIWVPQSDEIGTPHICDGERLQGFPENWTKVSVGSMVLTDGARWRLVGNAVTVPVSQWIGNKLSSPGSFDETKRASLYSSDKWPPSACGHRGKRWAVDIGEFPLPLEMTPLKEFLDHKLHPISFRAAKGFLGRFEKSNLKKDPRFVKALRSLVDLHSEDLPNNPPSQTSRKMRSVRQSKTNIEVAVEKGLRSRKMTFEQNKYAIKGIRTKPDIIFRNGKLAVYIDGCFWHSCPHHATEPKSNAAFWRDKLKKNVLRDRANTKALESSGWKVLRFWGHQDPVKMVDAIRAALRAG